MNIDIILRQPSINRSFANRHLYLSTLGCGHELFLESESLGIFPFVVVAVEELTYQDPGLETGEMLTDAVSLPTAEWDEQVWMNLCHFAVKPSLRAELVGVPVVHWTVVIRSRIHINKSVLWNQDIAEKMLDG